MSYALDFDAWYADRLEPVDRFECLEAFRAGSYYRASMMTPDAVLADQERRPLSDDGIEFIKKQLNTALAAYLTNQRKQTS